MSIVPAVPILVPLGVLDDRVAVASAAADTRHGLLFSRRVVYWPFSRRRPLRKIWI